MHKHDGNQRCVEIGPEGGPGVCLQPFFHGNGADDHLAGFFTGFEVEGQDERIVGALTVDTHFAGERPVWSMTGTLEGGNLTLAPSVELKSPPRVPFHGHIQNGRWVPVG